MLTKFDKGVYNRAKSKCDNAKEFSQMAGEVYFRILDYNEEASTFNVSTVDINAANFDAQIALVSNLYDALDDICIGNIVQERIAARNIMIASGAAGSVWAQRELKWFVPYVDNVTFEPGHRTIPCPDLTMLRAGTEEMNMALPAAIAFKAAFEAIHRGEDGNTVTMGVPYLVGNRK